MFQWTWTYWDAKNDSVQFHRVDSIAKPICWVDITLHNEYGMIFTKPHETHCKMNVMIYYVIYNIFTLFDLHKFGIQNAEHYKERLYSVKY